MAEEEYQRFEQADLSGGLNNSIDAAKLDSKYMIVMENLYFDPVSRSIKRRAGFGKFITTQPDTVHRAWAMGRFYTSNSAFLLLAEGSDGQSFPVTIPTQVHYYNPSTHAWNALRNATRDPDVGFCSMQGRMMIAPHKAALYWKPGFNATTYTLGMDQPSGCSVALAAGTGLSNGIYKYVVGRYSTAGYEGLPTTDGNLTVTVTAGSGHRVLVTLPAPSGQVVRHRVYRTAADLAVYYLVTETSGTSYTDSMPDSTLQTQAECDSWAHSPAPSLRRILVHKRRAFGLGGETFTRAQVPLGVWLGPVEGDHSSLLFSEVEKPYAWPPENYLEFDPDDGDQGREVASFADRIFFFKHQSFYVVNYSLVPLDGSIERYMPGILGRTVVVVPARRGLPMGAMIWLGSDKRVYLHDGFKYEPISYPIQTSLDAITEAKLLEACAEYDSKRSAYLLTVDTNADNKNDVTFLFQLDTGGWTKYLYGFDTLLRLPGDQDQGEVLGASKPGVNGSLVYELETGTSDDGTSFSCTLQTPMLNMGQSMLQKQLRKMWAELKCGSADQLLVSVLGERAVTTPDATVTLIGTGLTGQFETRSLSTVPRNHFRLKFLTNSTVFHLLRYGFEYVTRRVSDPGYSIQGGIGGGEEAET